MSGLKDFFAAGLKMEAARERKAEARGALLREAEKKLPEEFAAFKVAGIEVDEAEKRFVEALRGVQQSAFDSAHEMLHQQGMECGDPKCRIGKAVTGGAGAGGERN